VATSPERGRRHGLTGAAHPIYWRSPERSALDSSTRFRGATHVRSYPERHPLRQTCWVGGGA